MLDDLFGTCEWTGVMNRPLIISVCGVFFRIKKSIKIVEWNWKKTNLSDVMLQVEENFLDISQKSLRDITTGDVTKTIRGRPAVPWHGGRSCHVLVTDRWAWEHGRAPTSWGLRAPCILWLGIDVCSRNADCFLLWICILSLSMRTYFDITNCFWIFVVSLFLYCNLLIASSWRRNPHSDHPSKYLDQSFPVPSPSRAPTTP